MDIEDELAKILQQEVWYEITKETGETQEDFDNSIIEKLKQIKQQSTDDE